MTCTQDCNQGRACKCGALLQGIVQTTRNAGCCNSDPLPDDHPGGWERAAYWAAVGLGAGFAAALVFFAPAAWVWAKVGGI